MHSFVWFVDLALALARSLCCSLSPGICVFGIYVSERACRFIVLTTFSTISLFVWFSNFKFFVFSAVCNGYTWRSESRTIVWTNCWLLLLSSSSVEINVIYAVYMDPIHMRNLNCEIKIICMHPQTSSSRHHLSFFAGGSFIVWCRAVFNLILLLLPLFGCNIHYLISYQNHCSPKCYTV